MSGFGPSSAELQRYSPTGLFWNRGNPPPTKNPTEKLHATEETLHFA